MAHNGLIFNSHFLPREILLYILDFVDVKHAILECRAVCRNWNNIIDDELWDEKLRTKNNLKSFSNMTLQQKRALNYPWFIYHEIFAYDPYSRNLAQNTGEPVRNTDLENGSIDGIRIPICTNPFFNLQYGSKKQICSVTLQIYLHLMDPFSDPSTMIFPAERDDTDENQFLWNLQITLCNQFQENVHCFSEIYFSKPHNQEITIELEDYSPDVRFIVIHQSKRVRNYVKFLPPNGKVNVELSLPRFREEEWNIISNDSIWKLSRHHKKMKSFSKTSLAELAQLNYPWYVTREIIDKDPYERNLIRSKLISYIRKSWYEGYGYWQTELLLRDHSMKPEMFLIQTICLRDHGIFGFILDRAQPLISVNMEYPDMNYSTSLFDWHIFCNTTATLLNSEGQVLHKKSYNQKNIRKIGESLRIDWKFEKYGVGVRYIRLQFKCRYFQPPCLPILGDEILPPVSVRVALPHSNMLI